MNKKAIASILARLDDPDMIETLLDLIANKADAPPAPNEATGQLFTIVEDHKPKRQTVEAPKARTQYKRGEDQTLVDMANLGYGYDEIAYRLGRSRKAIVDRLWRIRKGEIAV